MDTDGVILTDITFDEIYQKFEISKKVGDFKIENPKDEKGNFKLVDCEVYSNKTYRFGEQIKIAGVTKRDLKKEDWAKGEIKYTQRISERMAKQSSEVGKLKSITTTLDNYQEKYLTNKINLQNRKVYIDNLCKDYSYFKYLIKEYTKKEINE